MKDKGERRKRKGKDSMQVVYTMNAGKSQIEIEQHIVYPFLADLIMFESDVSGAGCLKKSCCLSALSSSWSFHTHSQQLLRSRPLFRINR